MKRTYLAPSIKEVRISVLQMVATSSPDYGGEGEDGDRSGSKRFYSFDWNDEEE